MLNFGVCNICRDRDVPLVPGQNGCICDAATYRKAARRDEKCTILGAFGGLKK